MKFIVMRYFLFILGPMWVVTMSGDESLLAGSIMIGILIPLCFYIIMEAREVWKQWGG